LRLHILILFNWLCIWLGHFGHCHRSSVRIRLQSQDDDLYDTKRVNGKVVKVRCSLETLPFQYSMVGAGEEEVFKGQTRCENDFDDDDD
jgi:hypothetical protein